MKLQKTAGLTAGICTVVTAATVGLAIPAQAAASSSVWVNTGSPATRAGEALFHRSNGTHSNKAWFDVNDTKCDASPVFLYYSIDGSGRDVKQTQDGGCGTTAGINLQTGYFTIKYRICVKTGTFTSKCSEWRSDHN
jgi:hypothetical protein